MQPHRKALASAGVSGSVQQGLATAFLPETPHPTPGPHLGQVCPHGSAAPHGSWQPPSPTRRWKSATSRISVTVPWLTHWVWGAGRTKKVCNVLSKFRPNIETQHASASWDRQASANGVS